MRYLITLAVALPPAAVMASDYLDFAPIDYSTTSATDLASTTQFGVTINSSAAWSDVSTIGIPATDPQFLSYLFSCDAWIESDYGAAETTEDFMALDVSLATSWTKFITDEGQYNDFISEPEIDLFSESSGLGQYLAVRPQLAVDTFHPPGNDVLNDALVSSSGKLVAGNQYGGLCSIHSVYLDQDNFYMAMEEIEIDEPFFFRTSYELEATLSPANEIQLSAKAGSDGFIDFPITSFSNTANFILSIDGSSVDIESVAFNDTVYTLTIENVEAQEANAPISFQLYASGVYKDYAGVPVKMDTSEDTLFIADIYPPALDSFTFNMNAGYKTITALFSENVTIVDTPFVFESGTVTEAYTGGVCDTYAYNGNDSANVTCTYSTWTLGDGVQTYDFYINVKDNANNAATFNETVTPEDNTPPSVSSVVVTSTNAIVITLNKENTESISIGTTDFTFTGTGDTTISTQAYTTILEASIGEIYLIPEFLNEYPGIATFNLTIGGGWISDGNSNFMDAYGPVSLQGVDLVGPNATSLVLIELGTVDGEIHIVFDENITIVDSNDIIDNMQAVVTGQVTQVPLSLNDIDTTVYNGNILRIILPALSASNMGSYETLKVSLNANKIEDAFGNANDDAELTSAIDQSLTCKEPQLLTAGIFFDM